MKYPIVNLGQAEPLDRFWTNLDKITGGKIDYIHQHGMRAELNLAIEESMRTNPALWATPPSTPSTQPPVPPPAPPPPRPPVETPGHEKEFKWPPSMPYYPPNFKQSSMTPTESSSSQVPQINEKLDTGNRATGKSAAICAPPSMPDGNGGCIPGVPSVLTQHMQPAGAAAGSEGCVYPQFWDGTKCRGSVDMPAGGLVNQAMNLGPSGGAAQAFNPGSLDINPANLTVPGMGRHFPIVNL